MEGIKGARSEQQSDRAENHHQNGLDLGCFEVQKVRFFFKDALGRSSKLCFLCRRGGHFQKNRENKSSESEKWSQKEVRWQVRWLYVRVWWGTKVEMLIFH